ncbi:MAG: FlgD immunoglobulin-like domain containing protein [Candidatus Poribacteria bacterium]
MTVTAPAGRHRFRLRMTRERLGPDITDAPTNTTALLANYPNPFNPETWIPFTLAELSSVTITIYDMRGVPVRELARGDLPAGRYSETGRAAYWDGRNEVGETVASGVYVYELRAGSRRELRRMVLLE